MKPIVLLVLTAAMLSGCSTVHGTHWVDAGFAGVENSGDVWVQPIEYWGTGEGELGVAVRVVQQVTVPPNGRMVEVEVEEFVPYNIGKVAANVPVGLLMIALAPPLVPVGIVAEVAGMDDIGHVSPALVPVACLVGGGMCLWVFQSDTGLLFSTPHEERSFRLTGRSREKPGQEPNDPPVPVEPLRYPGFGLRDPNGINGSAGTTLIPRPGLLVHLTDPATGKTRERWTNHDGVAVFGSEEQLRTSPDPLIAEVEVDGRVLKVELP